MVPRTALPFALLLAVTAGCLGAPPSPQTAETPPSTSATETPTPTTTAGTTSPREASVYSTDCPPHLGVDPAADRQVANADAVVAFGDLPPERREEFERALEGDIALEPGSEGFWTGTVVEHRGERYAAGVYVC